MSAIFDPAPGGANEMVSVLAASQTVLVANASEALTAEEEAWDPVTADLLVQRIAAHEKAAWMLRSLLA